MTPDEDLKMDFAPEVRRTEALKWAWSCQVVDEPNPRLDGVVCPLRVGILTIDVAEGPAGVSLTLRLGDARQAASLRDWYREKGH